VSHAYGTILDNPELITCCVVGDGEAETGPLATAWHSNKFINPARDGAVLPILNLNGYKIANPTILARISHEELEALFRGYGYTPYFVEGSDPAEMHQRMASVMEECVLKIKEIQRDARVHGNVYRPRWPMIVLRTPKGWTGPEEVDGHKVEGFWRAHQVPMGGMHSNPEHLRRLEEWMRSYKPEELFDENGTLMPELKELNPVGPRRMGSNPHANGGLLRRALNLPDFQDYAIEMDKPGTVEFENTKALGIFMRDIMAKNPNNFRLMGPDETASNRLQNVYEVTKKAWMARFLPRRPGRQRTVSGWSGDGNAQRAHPAGLAGRLSAHGSPRLLPHLRSLCPRGGFHVQPARQVAGYLQEPCALAAVGVVVEYSAVVAGVAAGSQRL
jgi:xylulose-5-phosphate/fructose-6-phosphate phosphoketolase